MAGRGFAKAYLSEPIDAEELAHLVKDLPIVKDQTEHRKNDGKIHDSAQVFVVAMKCDKVGKDGSDHPGIECVVGWGISDKEGRKIRKENARFLYIEAHNDWDEFRENWQPEVNQLMKAIQGLINPLIIDPLRER